eukprot:365847-Chlamydomonas_euryale.AAC.27
MQTPATEAARACRHQRLKQSPSPASACCTQGPWRWRRNGWHHTYEGWNPSLKRVRPCTCGHAHAPTTPANAHPPTTPAQTPAHAHAPTTPAHAHAPTTPAHAHAPTTPAHAHAPTTPAHTHAPTTPAHAHAPTTPAHAPAHAHTHAPAVHKLGIPVGVQCARRLEPLRHLPWASHQQRAPRAGRRARAQKLPQPQHVVCVAVRQPHAAQARHRRARARGTEAPQQLAPAALAAVNQQRAASRQRQQHAARRTVL